MGFGTRAREELRPPLAWVETLAQVFWSGLATNISLISVARVKEERTSTLVSSGPILMPNVNFEN